MTRRAALSLLVLLLPALGPGPWACARAVQPDLAGPEVPVRAWIGLDADEHTPVLVLDEVSGARRLPIWIGFSEARSINAKLLHEPSPRPNTHDLATRLIEKLEAEVDRVVVTDLRDGVYYASIVLRRGERTEVVDARPSDAIAIALRSGAPLFVREALFSSAARPGEEPRGREVRRAHPERFLDAQLDLTSP